MSASDPAAITPLRGYRPNILAGVVDATSTQRASDSSPATTPWCSRSIRCSTPGIPLGILEKSPSPSSFCSLKQNGQWSVDTTLKSLVRRYFHSSSWWPSALERSGVEHTHFAPSNPGAPSCSSNDRYRYCGQVSPKTWWPRSRAAANDATACLADMCTTYSGEPVSVARV